MDKQTLAYYAANATDVAQRYESAGSALSSYFGICFPHQKKILDVGCGSGRDLAVLVSLGFDAFGVDATPEFVDIAQYKHPELLGRITHGQLPQLGQPFGGEFDGILCSAVLMHLDDTTLVDSVRSFREALKNEGRVLISVSATRLDADLNGRDQYGRLFKNYSAQHLKTIFEVEGFRLLQQWGNFDTLQRKGIEWLTQLYQRVA
jgi:2-polyprenyl-3-methyl-5-hydroxy-6-metoxy-1,4-benzoquinol methylase